MSSAVEFHLWKKSKVIVYVVVQFYPWFNFYFPLF